MVAGFIRRGGESGSGISSSRINIVALVILLGCAAAGAWATVATDTPVPVVVLSLLGLVLMQSPKVAKQWERAVVLARTLHRAAGAGSVLDDHRHYS